jgi:phosphoribosylformylglycinamidine synthase
VTSGQRLVVRHNGVVVADVPNRALTDEAPVYHRPFARPADIDTLRQIPFAELTPAPAPAETFLRLLGSPTVASKRWIFRQYDHMVRTNTIALNGLGAGVVRVKDTDRALAMSVDGNGRFCLLDPRRGAMLAVAEAARNVACAGGMPIGATNCLNFGNPQRTEIMWQFAEAVAGIGEACRALDVPITGGNVSLYNETDGRAILPTPIIGVVGLVEHADHVRTRVFRTAGHEIVLLGENLGELGGSEFLKTIHGLVRGETPALDLDGERALQRLLVELASRGLSQSAHDCAEGGVAVTLAECCFDTGGVGADVALPAALRDGGFDVATATLFGESASRVIVSVAPDDLAAVLAAAKAAGVPALRIGRTGGGTIKISIGDRVVVDVSVAEAEGRWAAALENWLDGRAA